MNIRSAIILGAKILNGKLIKTAYLDSEILMACAINKDRKFVILNPNENIDPWCCKKGIKDISPPGPLIINSLYGSIIFSDNIDGYPCFSPLLKQ